MVTTCLPAGSWRAFSPTAVIPNMIPLLILLMSTRLLSSVASKKLSPTIISLRVTVFVTLCVSNKVPVILSMILPYPISLLLLIIIWFVLTVTPAWVRLPTMTLLPYWKWIVFTWAAHLQETLALSIMILGGIAILPRLSFVFFRLPVISPSQRSFRVVCSKPEANMVGIGRARSFPASSAMLGTCLSTRTLRSRTTETLNTTGFPFVCSPINK